jgi:hypothetical protein
MVIPEILQKGGEGGGPRERRTKGEAKVKAAHEPTILRKFIFDEEFTGKSKPKAEARNRAPEAET